MAGRRESRFRTERDIPVPPRAVGAEPRQPLGGRRGKPFDEPTDSAGPGHGREPRFIFGQYIGVRFSTITEEESGYYVWARGEKRPGRL